MGLLLKPKHLSALIFGVKVNDKNLKREESK
jgi:hypothetical protein